MIHTIAHRGASAYEPENTLRAFDRAIVLGATMLELDVHLSRDGQLMVLHDPDLSRTTNGAGRVTELSLAEIQRLDAGLGEHVPTLPEVIDLVRGRAQIYIEMKGQQTPAAVVDTLRRMGFIEDAIAASFFPWLPQRVKFLEPAIRTSVLIAGRDREADFVGWALAVQADYVHPCWEAAATEPHRLLTPELIAAIRGRGLGIVVWHEERVEELCALARLDVDGICTNTPDVLARILAEAGHKQ